MKEGSLSPTALPAFHGSSALGGFYLVTALLGLGINLLTKDELPALPLLSVGRVSHTRGQQETSGGLPWPHHFFSTWSQQVTSLVSVLWSVKVAFKMLECMT